MEYETNFTLIRTFVTKIWIENKCGSLLFYHSFLDNLVFTKPKLIYGVKMLQKTYVYSLRSSALSKTSLRGRGMSLKRYGEINEKNCGFARRMYV